jgi:hypothetical protein
MATDYLDEALPNNNLRAVIIAFYASNGALPACTYANGTLGVGATLTGNANGALAAQDGIPPAANDILLVKDQASGLQNGVYIVTTLGTAGTPFVLTRITAADTAAKLGGCYVSVQTGTLWSGATFKVNTLASALTIGTTAITFSTKKDIIPVNWGVGNSNGNATQRYMPVNDTSTTTSSTSEPTSKWTVPPGCSGFIDTLSVTYEGTALTTDDYTNTLRKNGSDTALTLTVTHGTQGNTVTVTGANIVTFTAGDTFSLGDKASGTEASVARNARGAIAGRLA